MKRLAMGIGGCVMAMVMASTAMARSSVVFVRNIQHAGTGCPVGSLASRVSDDLLSIGLDFDSFVAEAGPGVSLRESRKNCQILLDLAYPAGWQYTIDELEQTGFVSLERGATATHQVSYYFQGQGSTANLITTFQGPIDTDYVINDVFGPYGQGQVWSPCGATRALNINISARISATGRRSGLMTVDSPLGSLGQLKLKWRRC